METQITLTNTDLLEILGKHYLDTIQNNTHLLFGSIINTINIYDLEIKHSSLNGFITTFKIKHVEETK